MPTNSAAVIETAIRNRVLAGGNTNAPKSAGAAPLPLYKPQDTEAIKLIDTRSVNPATGMPFKEKGGKTLSAKPSDLALIISHAKAKGVDPYTALAIAYQESGLGSKDPNYGMVNSYFPDQQVSDKFATVDERTKNENANMLAKALKDKTEYAKKLGYDKKGDDFVIQAYNGYGKLQAPAGTGIKAFYGIPVSPGKPLNMAENPAYGRTVASLRDEILKKNPAIQRLIEETQAYQ